MPWTSEMELTAAILDDVVMGALGSFTAVATAAPGWVMEKVGLDCGFAGDGGAEEEDDDDSKGEDRVKVGSTRASGSTSLNRVVGDCCGLLGSGWTAACWRSSATATGGEPARAVAAASASSASSASASPPPLLPVPVPVPLPLPVPLPETAEATDDALLLRLRLRPLAINSTSDGRARSCGRRPNMHSCPGLLKRRGFFFLSKYKSSATGVQVACQQGGQVGKCKYVCTGRYLLVSDAAHTRRSCTGRGSLTALPPVVLFPRSITLSDVRMHRPASTCSAPASAEPPVTIHTAT